MEKPTQHTTIPSPSPPPAKPPDPPPPPLTFLSSLVPLPSSPPLPISSSVTLYQLTSSPLLKLKCSLKGDKKKEMIEAMVDSGASTSFISREYVKKKQLTVKRRPVCTIMLGNNTTCTTDEEVVVELVLTDTGHVLLVSCLVLSLSTPIIFGMDFLSNHNPNVDWRKRQLTFQTGKEMEGKNSKKTKTKKKMMNKERQDEKKEGKGNAVAHLQLHSFVSSSVSSPPRHRLLPSNH